MGKFYVYAHVDKATQTPFYIGIGRGKRPFDKSRSDLWKLFVEKYAKDYEVKVVAENVEEDIAREIENLLIKKFGKVHSGKGILLNWTDGGYAEGLNAQLFFEDNSNELVNMMTEYGQRLQSNQTPESNAENLQLFLTEVLDNKSKELRHKIVDEIGKKVKPRIPLIIPFCISEQIKKSDVFSVQVSNIESINNIVNKPIDLTKLPSRQHVDFIIHRIMIYFDMILQENVILERNGTRISKSEADWYFYKDYWKAYVKTIQAKNRGLTLEVDYFGRNTKDSERKDIYDFKISFK